MLGENMKKSTRLISSITEDIYLLAAGLVFLATGMGLFMYCLLYGLNIGLVITPANPLFYLATGLGLLLFRYFLQKAEKIKKDVK